MELFYIFVVLLVVTRGSGEIAQRLGQPALVGELVSGMILGVIAAKFSVTLPTLAALNDNQVFAAFTDLGIFFLMLLAGLEMRPREFADSTIPAIWICTGGFLLQLIMGLGLGFIILPESVLKMTQVLFIGVAISITAVPIIVRVLVDLNKLNSLVGRTIVSAAVFDDVLSLLLLAALTTMIKTNSILSVVLLAGLALKILIFFALTLPIGYFVFPVLGKLFERFQIHELGLSFILIVGFGFSLLADELGLHFMIGAFIGGLFFERKTFGVDIYEHVQNQVSGITTGFLAPIFFASIGFHLDLLVVTQAPVLLAILIFVAIFGKFFGAAVPAKLCGFSRQEALFIGSGMTARGAVELVVAEIALRNGLFTQPINDPIVSNLFSAVIFMTLFTTVGAPILMKYFTKEDPKLNPASECPLVGF